MNENQNDTLINPPISVDLIIGEWSQGKKCQYIMDAVLNFMTNTLYGVIICSVVASLLATFLYKYLERKVRYHRAKKVFIEKASAFMLGERAAIATTSSYKQILLVGDYIIEIMKHTIRIVLYTAITVILVIVLRNSLFWGAPVVVSVFLITFELQKIKRLCEYYEQNIKYVYGEDYLEKEVEHAINYAKGKNNTNSDAREVSDTQ